jgi:hypothetical protein
MFYEQSKYNTRVYYARCTAILDFISRPCDEMLFKTTVADTTIWYPYRYRPWWKPFVMFDEFDLWKCWKKKKKWNEINNNRAWGRYDRGDHIVPSRSPYIRSTSARNQSVTGYARYNAVPVHIVHTRVRHRISLLYYVVFYYYHYYCYTYKYDFFFFISLFALRRHGVPLSSPVVDYQCTGQRVPAADTYVNVRRNTHAHTCTVHALFGRRARYATIVPERLCRTCAAAGEIEISRGDMLAPAGVATDRTMPHHRDRRGRNGRASRVLWYGDGRCDLSDARETVTQRNPGGHVQRLVVSRYPRGLVFIVRHVVRLRPPPPLTTKIIILLF